MRPPRIPHSVTTSLPFALSSQPSPDKKTFSLTITATEEWLAEIQDGLAILSEIAREAKRAIEAGYRDLHTRNTLEDLEEKYSIIRAAYRNFRSTGMKHRQAVHALMADGSVPFCGQWKFSDFNWCVRTTPRTPPTLKAVPLKGERSR